MKRRRRGAGVGAGVALLLVAGAPSAVADTRYPPGGAATGGSTFNAGTDGWQQSAASCDLLPNLLPIPLPSPACEAKTTHAAADGVPPGSLEQSATRLAGGLGLLAPLSLIEGSTTARSQIFTVAAPGFAPGAAVPVQSFSLDRRVIADTLLNLGDEAEYRVRLVQLDAANAEVPAGTRTLLNETIGATGSTLPPASPPGEFARRATTPPGTVIAGARYRLELSTTFRTGLLSAALGRIAAQFDNVRLQVADGTPAFVSAPTALALPVTGIGATAATLNSSVNPNGSATTFHYEYGTVASGAFGTRVPVSPDALAAGDGITPVSPSSVPISGLTAETDYQVRVVATNAVGTATSPTVTFRTNGTGAQGPTGATGPAGTPGATGPQGAAGADGAAGPQGVAGAQGVPGAPGTPGTPGATGPVGPVGPAGPQGAGQVAGQSITNINSTSRRALFRIDAGTLTVPLTGRDAGRVRVKVFCRRVAVQTCSGTAKVRSISKINPASVGTRTPRRVTFATDAVQLDEGKIGFVILNFNTQRRAVLKRIKQRSKSGSLPVSIIISAIDANNNRQNVRATARLRAGR